MTRLEDSFAELVAYLGEIKEHIADKNEAQEKAAFAVVMFLRINDVSEELVDPLWTLCTDFGERFVQTPSGFRKRAGRDPKLPDIATDAMCLAAIDLLMEEGCTSQAAIKQVLDADKKLDKKKLSNKWKNAGRKSRATSELAEGRALVKDYARKNGGAKWLLARISSNANRVQLAHR